MAYIIQNGIKFGGSTPDIAIQNLQTNPITNPNILLAFDTSSDAVAEAKDIKYDGSTSGSNQITIQAELNRLENINAKKLLWTNPTPNAAFEAQSITLADSLDNYDFYLIEYAYWYATYTAYRLTSIVPVGVGGALQWAGEDCLSCRMCDKTNSTTLSIGNAYYYATYGNTAQTTNNGRCIPYKIWGIRFKTL